MTSPTLQAAFEKHDSAIASLGFDIWVGMEPTFTQRYAETSEWLSEALGPEKLSYAYKMLDEMRRVRPGGIVVHSLGRQYSGEALPRWCIGYYTSRNGSFVWNGPEDPRHAVQSQGCDDPEAFWLALADRLNRSVANEPWQALTFQVDEKLGYRLLLRCDGEQPVVDMNGMAALSRPSVHSHKIPLDGLVDELAARGDLLLSIGTIKLGDESQSVALELPYINDVAV
ncbi:MAG: transglutaminase family protein, partial [Gammaproteobacteria bacterium]